MLSYARPPPEPRASRSPPPSPRGRLAPEAPPGSYMYIYIYIYIERERDVFVYIYIYIYIVCVLFMCVLNAYISSLAYAFVLFCPEARKELSCFVYLGVCFRMWCFRMWGVLMRCSKPLTHIGFSRRGSINYCFQNPHPQKPYHIPELPIYGPVKRRQAGNGEVTHRETSYNDLFCFLFDSRSLPLPRLPGVCSGGGQGILQRL